MSLNGSALLTVYLKHVTLNIGRQRQQMHGNTTGLQVAHCALLVISNYALIAIYLNSGTSNCTVGIPKAEFTVIQEGTSLAFS